MDTKELEPTQTVKEYLKRIQFPAFEADGQAELPAPTLENLVLICRCHSLHIPFENLLFVHHTLKGTARPIDQASLRKRIVLRQRGGMCQEMNALLLHNLQLLGYSGYAGLATMVVAAGPAAKKESSEKPVRSGPGSHFIVLVQLDGHTYVCDVGAGPQGLAEPVLLRAHDDVDSSGPSQQPPPADWLSAHGEYDQFGLRFRLRHGILGSAEPLSPAAAMMHSEPDKDVGYFLQHCIKGVWKDVYWFQRTPVDEAIMQPLAQNSFKSHPLFTEHMIVHTFVPAGRIMLMDFVLKTWLEGQPAESRTLASEEERDAVLQEVFGLDLAGPPLPL